MKDQVRLKLESILKENGLGLVRDPQRCENLLQHSCENNPTELFLLITALKAGVVSELLNPEKNIPVSQLIDKIAIRLHKTLALVEESAKWAVASWAVALGLTESRELFKGVIQPVPEECEKNQEVKTEFSERHSLKVGLVDTSETFDSDQSKPSNTFIQTESLKVNCPNCAVPLTAEAALLESLEILCPSCYWKFWIDENGKIINPGEVKTNCPYPKCGHPIIVTGGGLIFCPECDWYFQVDGNGTLLGGLFPCPNCNQSLFHLKEGGDMICDECEWNFSIDSDWVLSSGFAIQCPYCGKKNRSDRSENVNCSSCQKGFTIDKAGLLTGGYINCPNCLEDVYYSKNGGENFCGECKHCFETDSWGEILKGLVVECPLCGKTTSDCCSDDSRCGYCGLRFDLSWDGEVIEIIKHEPLALCPSCKRKFRWKENCEICPRCGNHIGQQEPKQINDFE